MIHVTPWSPFVIEADVSKFYNENPGCCPHCAAPLGTEHQSSAGVECWLLRHRRDSRMGWIAYLHLKGQTPERDKLIAEMRETMEYDRDALLGWIEHHREHTLVPA